MAARSVAWALIAFVTAPAFGETSGVTPASEAVADPRCIVYLRTEVRGDRGVAVWAEATLEAPPGKVYDTLTDFERYPEYLPRVLRSERRPGDRAFTELKAPWPLRNIWFITRIEKLRKGAALLFRWSMEKGNIRRNEGAWSVRPLAGSPTSARVRYEGFVELNNALPPALLKLVEEYELPRIVQALRKRTVGDKDLTCGQTTTQRL